MIAPSSLLDIGSSDTRRRSSRARRYRTAIVVALALAASTAFAATIHTVVQKGRNFAVNEIVIARGDTIRFTNEDDFLHQIYVDSKDIAFDSAEQRPGQALDVKFPLPGTFPVRCHIHPKMLLWVAVE
jgi:plastocyanin